MQNIKKTGLILFLKYPEKGKVKSRLASDIGENAALELYKCFIIDILNKFIDLDLNIFVYITPGGRSSDLEKWVSCPGFFPEIRIQQGEDLGERMSSAFKEIFNKGIEKAMIIGSDLPDLPRGYIADASLYLQNESAVLGPTLDGGYYLIGIQKDVFIEDLFRGIEWSTDKVLSETINVFRNYGIRVKILKEWSDIDTLNDLFLFNERSGRHPAVNEAPETLKKLKELKIF